MTVTQVPVDAVYRRISEVDDDSRFATWSMDQVIQFLTDHRDELLAHEETLEDEDEFIAVLSWRDVFNYRLAEGLAELMTERGYTASLSVDPRYPCSFEHPMHGRVSVRMLDVSERMDCDYRVTDPGDPYLLEAMEAAIDDGSLFAD